MKKILWVVNTIFPEASIHIGKNPPMSGGWMYGLAIDLAKSENIQLAVVTVYSGKKIESFEINNIHYYLIPKNSQKSKQHESYWKAIISEYLPDLVHIHGTEFSHGMALMNALPDLKYIISIQGLVSVISRNYLAGISNWSIIKNITFRDIIRLNTLFHAKHDFYKRGIVEKKYIHKASGVIGRTDWDRAHTLAINPKISYHFCNESLRDDFYTDKIWNLENCRKNSIFLSQASYPIKGIHQVIKAVALLKKDFPDILVEIAGHDITNSTSIKELIKRNGYGKYINSLLKKHNLKDNFKFLGPLSANEMINAYLRANIFICPSNVENSPNSLGEAQILGVPCIATYCGGIPSMVTDNESSLLYHFDDYEILALKIKSCFIDRSLTKKLSVNSHTEAKKRHDRIKNTNDLLSIYYSYIK